MSERKTLIFSIILNIVTIIFKFIGGIFFNCYALIVDGIYTFCNIISDTLALIGSIIGHKKANRKYPFGYGRALYIINIFIGTFIIIGALLMLYFSLKAKVVNVNFNILYILIFIILLKTFLSSFLYKMGGNLNSNTLIMGSKEALLDTLSSVFIVIIVLVSPYFSYADKIGCLVIDIAIILFGYKIIRDNTLLLIGEDDNNKEIKNGIKKIVNSYEDINYADCMLIKNGLYYTATVTLAVDNKLLVKDLIKKELKLKKALKKNKKWQIKYVDFEIIKG